MCRRNPQVESGDYSSKSDVVNDLICKARALFDLFEEIVGLMLKDMDAVADLAQTSECNLPLMNAARKVYPRAEACGLLRADLAALLSLYPAPAGSHA